MVSPTAGSHRMLGSGPLIYIPIAVFIDRVLSRLERWRIPKRAVLVFGTIVVAALMIGDLYYYFSGYINGNELLSPERGISTVHDYVIGLQARYPDQLELVCVGFNNDYCQGTNLEYLVPQLLARAVITTDVADVTTLPPLTNRPRILVVNSTIPGLEDNVKQQYPNIQAEDHVGPVGEQEFASFEIPPAN